MKSVHVQETCVHLETDGEPKDTDDAALKRQKRQAIAAQRKLQQMQHRCSALCSLARGMVIDRATSCKAVQASVLSVAPPALQEEMQHAVTTRNLEKVVIWIKSSFYLCEPDDMKWGSDEEEYLADVQEREVTSEADYCSPAAQRVAAQLLGCISRRAATEEQMAGILVAFLRSVGATARFVCSLQVLPQ